MCDGHLWREKDNCYWWDTQVLRFLTQEWTRSYMVRIHGAGDLECCTGCCSFKRIWSFVMMDSQRLLIFPRLFRHSNTLCSVQAPNLNVPKSFETAQSYTIQWRVLWRMTAFCTVDYFHKTQTVLRTAARQQAAIKSELDFNPKTPYTSIAIHLMPYSYANTYVNKDARFYKFKSILLLRFGHEI